MHGKQNNYFAWIKKATTQADTKCYKNKCVYVQYVCVCVCVCVCVYTVHLHKGALQVCGDSP